MRLKLNLIVFTEFQKRTPSLLEKRLDVQISFVSRLFFHLSGVLRNTKNLIVNFYEYLPPPPCLLSDKCL